MGTPWQWVLTGMLRRLMKAQEIFAPALFDASQYGWHIRWKRGLVYPDVTRRLFAMIGSQDLAAVDVGANYGLASRYFARHFRTVHAIEPVPFLARRLDQRFGQSSPNARANIHVHPCAVGDRAGTLRMRTPIDATGRLYHPLSTASAGNSLGMFSHAGIVEYDVPEQALDALLPGSDGPRVGFIKIDVEGFEASVLAGAAGLLVRDRPILQIEIDRTHNPDGLLVIDGLVDQGYAAFGLSRRGLHDNARHCVASQPIVAGLHENALIAHIHDFLFVPTEQLPAISALIHA